MAPHTPKIDPRWPPAFSPEFISAACTMLQRRSALLIVGPPGSNRHRLATEIVKSDGFSGVVLRHLCKLGDFDQPYQLLAQVLADLDGPPDVPADDLVEAIRTQIRLEHDTAPTLLLDDATFASAQTLTCLASLAVSRDLRIITSMTAENVRQVPDLAAVAERIDLTPLDSTKVAHMLRARFGGKPDEVLVGFVKERSAGAYASLCEGADLLDESGAIANVEGSIVLRPDVLEEVRLVLPDRRRSNSAGRLGRSTDVVNLIDLVSVIGEVYLDEALACTSREAVDLAVTHGPLRMDDDVLCMVDPLEAESVIAAIKPQRLKELWAAFAASTRKSCVRPASAIHAARWYLEVGQRSPVDLAQSAAREANCRGLYRRTVLYTADTATDASAVEIQHERAYALLQLRDRDQLLDLFKHIDPALVPTRQLLAYLFWATRIVPDEDLPAFFDRTTLGWREPECEQRLASIELCRLQAQSFSESSEQHIRRVRALLFGGALSTVDTAVAHSVLATFLRHHGRTAESVHTARIAIAMLESPSVNASAPELDLAFEALYMCLLADRDLKAAHEVLHQYQSRGFSYGRSGRFGPIMAGVLNCQRGNFGVALASLSPLLEHPDGQECRRSHGWGEALAAQALIGLGRVDEAERMLTRSLAHRPSGLLISDLERRLTQAFVHDSLADPDRALELLAGVVKETREHGLALVELDALGMTVLVDGPRHAAALLDAASKFSEPTGYPAMWLRFAKIATAYDFRSLIAFIDDIVAEGQLSLAARFAQFALDSGRRASDISPKDRQRLNLIAHPPH